MIYAVDFDGTLCEFDYPNIGKPKKKVIDFCIQKQKEGHKIILWTCRVGSHLKSAVEWCEKQGLVFDAVNENLIERIDEFGGDCRKVSADFYIDDKNILVEEVER